MTLPANLANAQEEERYAALLESVSKLGSALHDFRAPMFRSR